MCDVLKGLNIAQTTAVVTTEGYVRTVAGAGSGKTRALAHRFAYLVNEMGIMPSNILCVTFTNKSAAEMKRRINSLTGDNDSGYICTFHSFCVSVLQEDSYAVQYPKNFLVLDNSDINSMLDIIYAERGLTLRDMPYNRARDMIEIKKLFEIPDYYMDMIEMSPEVLHEKYLGATEVHDIIFWGYLYQEKKCFGLDYNDLIKFTLYIFEKNEKIRTKWQKRLEYIMIDEFQDIDSLQYELMEVLQEYHKNLFVVGDPDQTIYTWRGADVAYLLDFDKVFPETKTIMMMENYRSTSQILNAANSLISKNKLRMKKELVPTLEDGAPVHWHHAPDQGREAQWIAEETDRLLKSGVRPGDIAILYRAHFVSRSVEEALLAKKIPYTIYSGVQFFDRMEIKDTLSYLRMLVSGDDLSFSRIINKPRRNMGVRRMEFLRGAAERENSTLYEALCRNIDDPIFKGTKAEKFISLIEYYKGFYGGRPISEVLTAILHESGYEEMLRTEGDQARLDNLAELKQAVYEYETECGEETTLESYLAHIALYTNSDASDNGGCVRLMTVHTAKGLEFSYVFLCSMNEGVFPSKKTNSQKGMEEERRLAFVAVTRAMKRLYLSDAEGWNHDGSPRYPSRFIFDIGEDLLEISGDVREDLKIGARNFAKLKEAEYIDNEDIEIFSQGCRVHHKVFGDGTVLGADRDAGAHTIQFDSMPTARNISFKVKLDKI